MVAKISIGKSVVGALLYNKEKVTAQEATVLFTNKMANIAHGENHLSLEKMMNSFNAHLANNHRTENPVIHISLNPDPNDKLSEERLSTIAKEYMKELGFKNQPFIVFKHKDIDREHIHIVSVRIDENGRKLDDSYQYRRSMEICRKLERKYNLYPATPRQRREGDPLQKIDYRSGDIKHKLSNIVKSTAHRYHYQSLNEYKVLLNLYNVTFDEEKGVVNGKPYHGIVYSVTDDQGQRVGVPFKSSRISPNVGSRALLKRCEKPLDKERTKGILKKAIKNYRNRAQFLAELKVSGVEMVCRQNSEGRIYGVTFIDHETKCVLNGSRLGKEFSANHFNDLFNSPYRGEIDTQTHDFQPTEKRESYDENGSSLGLFDILTESEGVDYEEEAFRRKLKRKKKQRKI